VFSLTMLLRTTLLTLALALSAAPALAQNPPPPALTGLKPCYVVANAAQREPVTVSGTGFTAYAKIDLYVDNVAQTFDPPPQADQHGMLSGSVQAPEIDEGQRTFSLRAAEENNANNAAVATSKVTRLAVEQSPPAAKTSERVRFRGRGFTNLFAPVYMHYVFGGRSKKTIQIGLPNGDCGLFSTRRKQFPFKQSPQRGVWTIQFDQEAKYNPQASPRVPLTIKVAKKIKPTRARGR
jgi:hypothetical protein